MARYRKASDVLRHLLLGRSLICCLVVVAVSGCETGSETVSKESASPGYMVLSADALSFASDEDSTTFLVQNTGDVGFSFEITPVGEDNGVNWLVVSPDSGELGGRDAAAILVRIVQREQLAPGDYHGTITVSATGQESRQVTVSLTVGQPILTVDPADSLFFDATTETSYLNISNAGAGMLSYRIYLPGIWLSADVIAGEISGDKTDTIAFVVKEDLVPWYGKESVELIITSNGMGGPLNDGTAKISVVMSIDPACSADQPCTKPGFYCHSTELICKVRLEAGQDCTNGFECGSGYCEDGVCCTGECSEQCESCNQDVARGSCLPLPDGSACEDGLFCTDGDLCDGGVCNPGFPTDCSAWNSPCDNDSICDEEDKLCVPGEMTDTCFIDGKCYASTELHPEVACLRCDPGQDTVAWSAVDGICDDGDLCTAGDTCNKGICSGESYGCDDLLDCTDDACSGDGSCTYSIQAGNCLIESICHNADTVAPGSFGCASCNPDLSQLNWSPSADAIACDDTDLCTDLDHCMAGLCVGDAKLCDDKLDCTIDACNLDDGECVFGIIPGYCVIADLCWETGAGPDGPDEPCRLCNPANSVSSWTSINEGGACNDDSKCSLDSVCLAGICSAQGPLCDDGNPCTQNICTDVMTCEHPPEDDGTDCPADEFECTTDECLVGNCSHDIAPQKCLIDGQCFDASTPNPEASCQVCTPDQDKTTWVPGFDGEDCDDLLFCTINDQCNSGDCTGTARDCGADQCLTAYCVEEHMKCILEAVPNGTDCDDSDPCTVVDQCTAGSCSGQPKQCGGLAGDNPCLEGLCDPDSEPTPGTCKASPLDWGVPCDDGLTCMTDTTCDGGGQCQGGDPIDDADCSALLINDNPCIEAVCVEPEGCLLQPVPSGEKCNLPHSVSECQEGGCIVLSCHDGFDNCNEENLDGCEVWLDHDPSNCGSCELVCILENAVAACLDGECIIGKCNADFTNCDNSHETGCEAAVMVNPSRCGDCNTVCFTSDPTVVGICQGGACIQEPCEPGTLDSDGNPSNGCENQTIIYVDQANQNDPLADGTVQHPYSTIQEGLDATEVDYTVYIQNGAYTESLTIENDGIALTGQSADEVIIKTLSADVAALTVTANGAAISNLTIDGGRYGVYLAGTPAFVLTGCKLTDLTIANQSCPDDGNDGLTAGIRLDFVEEAEVAGCTITNIIAGNGENLFCGSDCPAAAGGTAFGIYAAQVAAVTLSSNAISEITGGRGGDSGSAGGDGGSAIGIAMLNSTQCSISDSTIGGLTGGDGGNGGDQKSGGSAGGSQGIRLTTTNLTEVVDNYIGENGALTAGVPGSSLNDCQDGAGARSGAMNSGIMILSDSTMNDFAGNVLANIETGLGAVGENHLAGDGAPQPGVGFFIDASSRDNDIDLTNTIEDEPIIYLYGLTNVTINDLVLKADVNPTNLGKIVVLESSGITIKGNQIAGYVGASGEHGTFSWIAGSAGQPGYGIRLINCSDCMVESNIISNISGGQGGTGGTYAIGGKGGASYGIHALASMQLSILANTVASLTGGTGGVAGTTGQSGDQNAYGGTGGTGVGLYLESLQGALVVSNNLRFITGGPGGEQQEGAGFGTSGWATAYHFSDIVFTLFSNNVASMIRRHNDFETVGSYYCVFIDDCPMMTIRNLTCFGAGYGGGTGHGVYLSAAQGALVKVTDSIISNATGNCLHNATGNSFYLQASHSALHQCNAGFSYDAQLKTGVLQGDNPKFINGLAGNVKLLPSSPCVDTSNPASAYSLEPSPNGCRANMGAYGGTVTATVNPAAEHCE
jgi:hypothetical protein